MQCPYCGSDSQVLDSRGNADGVRRRRQCNACRRRFTTYERAGAPSLKVIKRSERVEGFDSDKLQRALERVCRGRSAISASDIRRIARDIEAELVDASAKSVHSGQIVDLALRRLADIDRIAYNRLAVNYIDESGHLRTDVRAQSEDGVQQLGLFGGDDTTPSDE
ncbi:ATP cone domain-containing protein [Haliangium ochraceum]|uniref:Transcriptional repressor NrdR n=1 Tax=Haliangium ochraceum (strain DSM 14365 / JCM 11303 / SMP-2) TaxID=502025 RepID=D0LGT6_HALO1|nr:ATP cone domain-containing protein [Haliangium ochraceum]ACY14658.1 ATP-cone domain protein [Haliangium ochraceum DSM 14365]